MTAPFVIFGLPRSRTAWLSAALSQPQRLVGHDLGIECRSPEEFVCKITGPFVGTCETGAAFAAPLLDKLLPGIPVVVVYRQIDQVVASLERLGFGNQRAEMEERLKHLQAIACLRKNTLVVAYSSLSQTKVGAQIYDHCIGDGRFDACWWRHMASLNIQVDIEGTKQRLIHNRATIDALKIEIGRRLANV